MRREPTISPPEVKPRERPEQVQEVREYCLITPLFGGGVEPGTADPVTVIRGPEIRGLLRFWWRATRGGAFGGDLSRMKAREGAIWGAAAGQGQGGPSRVIVRVQITKRGRPFTVRDRQGRPIPIAHFRSPYSYVAFPLRDRQASVLEGVTFRLELTYPKPLQADVHAALWAWETFGGVGARTRRGFGALRCEKVNDKTCSLPASPEEVGQYIREGLSRYVAEGPWPAGVPHLSRDADVVVSQKTYRSADEAWRALISALKHFRQMRHPDRRGRPYGRSRWPEPDAIRRATGSFGHRPISHVDKFPRGQLGLPIVFHFKDPGDPQDVILQGEQVERLASPVLLRPLLCRDGAVAVAVALAGSRDVPGDLVLVDSADGGILLQGPELTSVTRSEARAIHPLGGKTDVVDALMDFLRRTL